MSLLPSGVGQLALAIVAPFILPKCISAGSRWIHAVLNPSPKGTRTKLPPSSNSTLRPPIIPRDKTSIAIWRSLLFSVSLSIALFTILLPPHNLFLSLSPPRTIAQQFLPALRAPLDIRIPTDQLARVWQARQGPLKPLVDHDLALLNRLQTLDARLAYVAHGTEAMLNCSWCRPGPPNWDYLAMITPGLALEYLSLLAIVGLLLAGHRLHWRRWCTCAIVLAGLAEAGTRLNWQGTRGGPSGGSVVMVHSILHLYRHSFCSIILVVAYFLPPRPIPQHPSAVHLIEPVLNDLVQRSEQVLGKLRVANVLRMSIMQDAQRSELAKNFWSQTGYQSAVARADPAIQAYLNRSSTAENRSDTLKAVDAFRELTETAFMFNTPSSQPTTSHTASPEAAAEASSAVSSDAGSDASADAAEPKSGPDKQGKIR